MPEAVGLECTDKVSDLVEFVKQVPSDPGMQSLQDGIQYFEEAVPIVVKALDNVAKIHPFIGSESTIMRLNYRSQALSRSVCFRSAYEFEKTRQDNNNQCRILFLEMNDMMLVLLE